MFREIRRNREQILSKKDCLDILRECNCGVLSLLGDDNYPYGVPLNYVLSEGKIYFHCAKEGHKIDAIQKNEKASFTVIDSDKVIPEEFTTYYRSVIVFGRAELLNDPQKKKTALLNLIKKYSPNFIQEGSEVIEKFFDAVQVIEFSIEHISGKESIKLAQAKKAK